MMILSLVTYLPIYKSFLSNFSDYNLFCHCFRNLLQVEIANLGFYSLIMQEIFNNPSLLEVSSLPMVVNVRCGYCWSEEVHLSFIKVRN